MTEEEEIQLTLDIQPGMKDSDTIKFDQVADEAVGHTPGDLIFVIKQSPDSIFTRQGDDLHINLSISLLESLVGFDKVINHLDGHEVHITKENVSFCSEIISVKGEGMPKRGNRNSHGDLFVTLTIDFPNNLSDSQKILIKQALA